MNISIKQILSLCDEETKVNIRYHENKETGIDTPSNHLNKLDDYILGDWLITMWVEDNVLILVKR